MGAVTKVLKKSAVQVVNAAKTYADKTDGYADDWTDAHILAMLNTYISTLEGFQSNPVLGKLNYSKYIKQIEKMAEPYESSASAKPGRPDTDVASTDTASTTDTTTTTDTATTTDSEAATAPTLQTATVKNTKITLTFDAALDKKAVPDASSFGLLVDGETVAIHHFMVKGSTVQMFVNGTDKIAGGAVVTLSYTDPTADDDLAALQGSDGMDVVSFTDYAVSNQGKVKPVKPVKGGKDSTETLALDIAGTDGSVSLVGVHAADFSAAA